jgi:hypothetical protein
MKTLTYVVNITFEDHINSDEEFKEVGENILSALSYQANIHGLAPEASETFTKEIEVSQSGLVLCCKELCS